MKRPFIIKPLGKFDQNGIYGVSPQPKNTLLIATLQISENEGPLKDVVVSMKISDGETIYSELKELLVDASAKADLVSGKVPSSQLPSYVDDILEFADLASFSDPGETGKIYVALDTNLVYRWSGSTYVEISPTPDLSIYLKNYSENNDIVDITNTGINLKDDAFQLFLTLGGGLVIYHPNGDQTSVSGQGMLLTQNNGDNGVNLTKEYLELKPAWNNINKISAPTTTGNREYTLPENGGILAVNVSSGEYTPTFTQSNGADPDNTITHKRAYWTKVGDIVTVQGRLAFTGATPSVEQGFYMTLPIPSDVSSGNELIGTVQSDNASNLWNKIPIINSGVNGINSVAWITFGIGSNVSEREISYQYSYKIILD